MDCNELQALFSNLQTEALNLHETVFQLQITISQLQTTISRQNLFIGILVLVTILLFFYAIMLKQQITILRHDNGEMIKRLEIISQSKLIN